MVFSFWCTHFFLCKKTQFLDLSWREQFFSHLTVGKLRQPKCCRYQIKITQVCLKKLFLAVFLIHLYLSYSQDGFRFVPNYLNTYFGEDTVTFPEVTLLDFFAVNVNLKLRPSTQILLRKLLVDSWKCFAARSNTLIISEALANIFDHK